MGSGGKLSQNCVYLNIVFDAISPLRFFKGFEDTDSKLFFQKSDTGLYGCKFELGQDFLIGKPQVLTSVLLIQ